MMNAYVTPLHHFKLRKFNCSPLHSTCVCVCVCVCVLVPTLRPKLKNHDTNKNYTTFNPDPDRLIYHPHGYDPATLVKMQSWALRRFYMRPRQLKKQFLELRTISPKMLLYGIYGMAV